MLSRFANFAPAPLLYVGGTTAAITPNTATNVSVTSLTGGVASAPAQDDLVVVYYGSGSTADRALTITTSGYTQIADLYANSTIDTNLTVAYKRMTATPDTVVAVSSTANAGDAGAVAIHVWRNVDSLVVLDTVSTTATTTTSVLCNPPSITPVTPGAVIIAGGAGGHNRGASFTFSSSDLSNFITIGGVNATNDVTIGIGSTFWTSGAFDPTAFTFSGTDSTSFSSASLTLALLPPQVPPGPFAVSQASTQNGASGTSLVINKPTGTRENDLMLACMNGAANVTWTGDTSWTEVADQGTNPSTRIAYKVAGASEGSSYTFTASASTTLSGTIVTYRNASYDAVGTITSGASPLVLSAVTATVPYSRILASVARSATSITITGPATMQAIATDNDATSPSRIVEEDINLSPAGSSGTRSFTVGSNTNVSGALVAIKRAASYTKYANYIASNSASAVAATSVSVNTPACIPGNVLVFAVAVANINDGLTKTVSTPSGWTLLFGGSAGSLFNYVTGLYIFYRTVDGTETTSYSATASSTTQMVGAIISLSGAVAATLTTGATSSSTSAGSTSIPANTVNASPNSILLYVGAVNNNNQGPVTFTPPSGMTEIVDASANGTTSDLSLGIAYQEGMPIGATGTKSATISSIAGTTTYRAQLVTVNPL